MWHVALVLFLTSLIAALVGFSGVAAGAAATAQFLFVFLLAAAAATIILDELVKDRRRR